MFFKKIIGRVLLSLLGLAILIAVSLLLMAPVFFLWNWLMPVIFSLGKITIWQAWGLCFLTGILFKNPSAK